MREILFRGKTKHPSEWVYGYFYQRTNPLSKDGEPIGSYISDLPPFGYEIDINTLGQYTGLKDKNGTKIFEGDILEYKNWFPCGCKNAKSQDIVVNVIWSNGGLNTEWFEVKSGHEKGSKQQLPLNHYHRRFEIIGNIHDKEETK